MNLEPYAPVLALVVLGALAILSFLRARGLLKRFGATTGPPEADASAPPQRLAPAPWWESHLQDYVAETTPPKGAGLVPVPDAVCEAESAVGEAPAVGPAPPEGVLAGERSVVPEQVTPVETVPCRSEYVMEAPVELWFGETRVGVRSGSDTERRFQRFAEVLFEELAAARSL